ncbi:branched-chain amino acid aminotransferase [Bacillus sp. BRMEA1]|uniref:branched-chain amino acid aminotransferase n=1 Tax=Neobacillus endophyticus TaxID=2738405 RepID=UPI001562FBBE|nr:branched-chain amino acid aminotransferase [Neobacillus endophyticus]NRD79919.1 branched-chain amino acid aminotransferase [Neobacillus endophyticus]
MNQLIDIVQIPSRKPKPDPSSIGFGNHFTDYMFTMDFEETKGWYNPRIVPYESIILDPSSSVFHYGQAVLEGLKAFITIDNQICLFRPDKHIQRLNISSERICIPQVNEKLVLEALQQLIRLEKEWIPNLEGTSLYIRPFIIATEAQLGVKPSSQYKFVIILSPVGPYYSEQLKPVKIYVENDYARAVEGGVGSAKTSGNYAASLKAQEKAKQMDYDQVLWLDSKEKKYVEEVGSMNIFFKINGEVLTPKLNGSFLGGITRDSVIELLKYWDISVREERIPIEDIYKYYLKGELEEIFGTGTAAVISPIGELNWNNKRMVINNNKLGYLSQKLFEAITDIQLGKGYDKFNWTLKI